MKELHMIVDLQYGSCGKGLLAGYLAETLKPDTIITAWSPNSGHTYINAEGRKMVNISLPNGIVSPNLRQILIGPGSIIDPDRLFEESVQYQDLLGNAMLLIHESAMVVGDRHRRAEAEYAFKIGSTMKGVGEALIEKISRRNPACLAGAALMGTPFESSVVSASEYNRALARSELAIIEGSQGFSLSINQGMYPYTTSRDCTVHQLLSDCAVPRKLFDNTRVHGVARTYPIRVANRYDGEGNMIGTSGPCYTDQEEITWDDIGIEPELTTVTKLPRRVFTWSSTQVRDAIHMNGVDDVFLNFANYADDEYLNMCVETIESESSLRWIGYGPTINDIMHVGD